MLGHVRRDLNVGHDWVALDVPVAEIGLGANVGDDLDSGRVEREVSSGIGQPGRIRSAHSCAGYEAGDNSGARFAPPWAGRRSSRASRTPSPSSCTCNRSPWRPISLPRPASPSRAAPSPAGSNGEFPKAATVSGRINSRKIDRHLANTLILSNLSIVVTFLSAPANLTLSNARLGEGGVTVVSPG